MTVIDLPQRGRPARTSFKVELYDSGNLAAADWPSLADSRDLKMYVFQSREFLEIWLNTIGKAGRIEPYLVVVKDGEGRPILYLPFVIETKFNIRLLRFMDCGVADYNAPIVAAGSDVVTAGIQRTVGAKSWRCCLALTSSTLRRWQATCRGPSIR